MYLTDLHVHTNYSDGKLGLRETIDFYGTRGFGAIAITDHVCETQSFLGQAAHLLERTLTQKTFPKYLTALEEEAVRAKELYGMTVIPGVEITKNAISQSESAHILALGIKSWISADQNISTICKQIRAQGALAIAAHPVSTRKMEPQTLQLWSRRHEYMNCFDAWEVASGPSYFREVAEEKIPKLATSDFHCPQNIRSWKTILSGEKNQDTVLAKIKKQNLSFYFYPYN